ncbi:PDZ domain-containing protein [Streptomyces scabiei]|uniref:PDZ domain-containing protein n=1 Tax=Streptomyces scabiei TaxID=1930 RepID=UPI001B31DBE0|nr:PDZ domain-containing protein [Streptomyces sp. LBUM 1483]
MGTTTAHSGLTVTTVEAGFSGDVAGVREGDRITAADGRPIRTPGDLSTAVNRHRSYSAMTLRIVRGTTTLTATLHLGYRPIGS